MSVSKGRKIPFNGEGKNLIDFFCIIGFEEQFIEEVIAINYPKQLVYDLSVLSSICAKHADTVFDESKLMKIIYPTIPEITENNAVRDKSSNVIFSFPISNARGNSQNVVCGFARLFYEPYHSAYLKKTIYLPKAVAIVSKFPYFSTFNSICSNVLLNFQNPQIANSFPIELVLYCIVNYTPSPLTSELILDLFPKEINDTQTIRLSQLSGYPIIDFNLSKLFKLLPLHLVIEVFIFTLLEVDMFFFSENLEMLNVVMYIFYALNYPLNDSMNFWHIFSLSKADLLDKSKPQFINSILSKCIIFLGVNCKYEDTLDMPKQFTSYSIIDLDSRKIIHKGESKFVEDSETIGKFIQKCIKGKGSSSFLKSMIKHLVDSINSANIDQPRMSLAMIIQKTQKFFEFNSEINETNRKIQESFYEVIIGLLKKFYKDHKISFDIGKKENDMPQPHKTEIGRGMSNELYSNKDESLFKLDYDPDDSACDKEELLIIKLFKTSTKFDNYFKNYLYDFSSQDNYLVPLMFSEEFINLNLSSATKINDNVNKFYFEVIDNFFYNSNDKFSTLNMNQNRITFDSLLKAVKSEVQYPLYNVEIQPKFVSKKSLRTSLSFLEPQTTNSFFKSIKLNKKALLRTIAYCNNIEDSMWNKLLPSTKLKTVNTFEESLSLRIVQSVEEAMISYNLVYMNNILLSALFSLFLVTNLKLSFYDSMVFFNHMTFQLLSSQYFIRKYIHYVLLSFYSLLSSPKFEGKHPSITQRIKMYYTLIISISNNNQVFPNEELTHLMISLRNSPHMKNPSEITIEEPSPGSKDKEITYSLLIIDKYSREISSDIIFKAVKSAQCSCNIEISKSDKETKSIETKIKFAIRNTDEISQMMNCNIKKDPQYANLYSPVKLKEKCEDIYEYYMKNGSVEGEALNGVTDFNSTLINIIYYSTISSDLKFFTPFLIKIFILYANDNQLQTSSLP